MEINTEYMKEVSDALARNIGLLGICLVNDGVNSNDVDQMARDTFDFISKRASEINVKHQYITENIINIVIMMLMDSSLIEQEKRILDISSRLGVSKEMIITEVMKDTLDGITKIRRTESESDKLLIRYDGRD